MPNFKEDFGLETILGHYLDEIYLKKDIDFIRIDNLESQQKGIDIIIKNGSNEYFIDEKAQLHYINSDLPTFTFELSYLKNESLKLGWLYDENKLTQYYFLVTGIYLKNGKTDLTNSSDIDKLKITSLNRERLITYLKSRGLDKEKILGYDSKLRKVGSFGRNIISELNSKSEGLIYYTEHLAEKPINLQLRLNFLIKNKIAKKFHYV